MKFVIFLSAVALCASVVSGSIHRGVSREHRFEKKGATNNDPFLWAHQRVDHFNPTDLITFRQRYLVNSTFWGGNGYPVFVDLGGEGPLSSQALESKYIIAEYARKTRALMIAIEHRFYGQSIPGGDLSLKNLRYLNTEQALADFAVLIQHIKQQYGAGPTSKVVTFGGSYAGSLSAWMRQKYPNVVHAALASSAPVLAQLDFPEYFVVVKDSIGQTCSNRVKQAFIAIENYMHTQSGKRYLEKELRACGQMENEKDEITFLDALSDTVAGVVQYSGDNNALGRFYNISRMCNLITTGSDPFQSFVNYVLDYLQFHSEPCISSKYSDEIAELGKIDPTSPNAFARSWTWQTCVEFGYYQTGSLDAPFSTRINLKYFTDACWDVFGVRALVTESAINYTNYWFGGRNIGSTRIALTNGNIDPWHALGVTTHIHPQMPVFYIKGTAHCADLYASSPDDLPALIQARTKILNFIQAWLQEN